MDGKTLITPETVVLVSGGARGITARCVIKLARSTPCKFILLGRTPVDEPLPEWGQGCPDDAELKQRAMNQLTTEGKKPTPQAVEKLFRNIRAREEVETTLEEIRKTGAVAEYLNQDVTAPVQTLQNELAGPIGRLGKINGIIHGAGSLSDRRIEKKTLQDFETVFAPKVEGLRNLLKVAPAGQLDFLVLFSSVVGFFGNIGQADYAMANEVLNKAAYQIKRDNPACHVVSIDWGPWDSGMVTPELKRAFAERDMMVIPTDAGAEILVKEITTQHNVDNQPVQIVVGQLPTRTASDISGELQKFEIHRALSLDANPFLLDHQIGLHPVLPATCAASWIASVCEGLFPGYTFFQLEDFKVLKGIVFDENLADEHVLELNEIDKVQGEKVKFAARIRSKNKSGRPIFHYSLNATLVREIPETSIHKVDLQVPSKGSEGILGKALYEDGTLFHGPSFQGVQRVVSMGEDRLVLEVLLQPIPPDKQGQFQLQTYNPFAYDAIVQSLLIWAQRYYQAPCLPSHLVKLEQFRAIPFGVLSIVDMKIISHNQTSVVADIIVTDTQGTILAKFTELQGTISPALKRFIGGETAPVQAGIK
ncbi:MAG: KR domain-containing protein [Anaerolineales bacterium]|jgi:NAD(P)-dependent dehydrogenase (short-subunit alcohol dehydrogenase family)